MTVAVSPLTRFKRKHFFCVFRFPFSTCHLVFKEKEGSRALRATASLACVLICLPPWPGLALPLRPNTPFLSGLVLLSGGTVSARRPCFPAAVGRNASLASDINSVPKTQLELVWQMDFTCCWKHSPVPPPAHCTRQPFPISQSPAQGAGSRAAPRHHLLLPASMLGPDGYICREE